MDDNILKKIDHLCSDEKGMVNFWDVARWILNQQSQYASRYVDWIIEWYPNLGDGLRFKWDTDNYHSLMIHKDDVSIFVERILEFRNRV